METNFLEPTIVVSKCLGFEACRYNAQILNSKLIEKLKNHAQIIPVCPEKEIGLKTPRPPLRLIKKNNKIQLIQPETNKNLTDKMSDFINDFLTKKLNKVDGFILKNRSPSCGLEDCKLYLPDNDNHVGKTDGLFAAEIKKMFPYAAIQDDGHLTNFKIREHFLIKIFMLPKYKKVIETNEINELIKFHTKNKYLLMAYNQELMRKMGKLTANPDNLSISTIIKRYCDYLKKILKEPAKYTDCINVLMHAFGYFSDKIEKEEKQFFLDTLEKYRNAKIPLSVPVNLLKSWIIKYKQSYLSNQSFFNPYPEELIDIKDSGQGR